MTLYCHICGKEIPSWTGSYAKLAGKLACKTPFGHAHKVCWTFANKRQKALSEGRENPWQAEDPTKLSGSELGRIRRAEAKAKNKIDHAYRQNITGRRKKYYKNPLEGTLSGMEID